LAASSFSGLPLKNMDIRQSMKAAVASGIARKVLS
jgi:hypothetical protein